MRLHSTIIQTESIKDRARSALSRVRNTAVRLPWQSHMFVDEMAAAGYVEKRPDGNYLTEKGRVFWAKVNLGRKSPPDPRHDAIDDVRDMLARLALWGVDVKLSAKNRVNPLVHPCENLSDDALAILERLVDKQIISPFDTDKPAALEEVFSAGLATRRFIDADERYEASDLAMQVAPDFLAHKRISKYGLAKARSLMANLMEMSDLGGAIVAHPDFPDTEEAITWMIRNGYVTVGKFKEYDTYRLTSKGRAQVITWREEVSS